MESSAATTGVGLMLVGASLQLVGLIGGVALREVTQLVVGKDPRRARFWLTEAAVIAVLAGTLGFVYARVSDAAAVGPLFGAALTSFAAVSGFHTFTAARALSLKRPVPHSLLHIAACIVIGVLSFTGALIVAGGRS